MKIILCNPVDTQGVRHSRKGMYVPLGLLSIATCIKQTMGDRVEIRILDEDMEPQSLNAIMDCDVLGLYSTSFNYQSAVKYAEQAKELGKTTILGGPHTSILAENILKHRDCFDYLVRFEGEIAMPKLIDHIFRKAERSELTTIPNLAFKNNDAIVMNRVQEVDLSTLPIPSREFLDFPGYVANYHSVYPENKDHVPGSIYSSKGCSWRDKTGGCVFCARLETGVRFRPIPQLWDEIDMLRQEYGVNYIWDIADDNLNNKEWFIDFVRSRPSSCQDMKFFIYSRVNPIKPWVTDYFKELNVEEVFLGVESGDNRLLKQSFKGQTRESAFRALSILNDNGIKFYPSFVLGLPGENEESMRNTVSMCKDIAELGGLDRMAATILKPTPGSKAYQMLIEETEYGQTLKDLDDIDLEFLERYWIDSFVEADYDTVVAYKAQIDEVMSKFHVFGTTVNDKS